MKKIYMRMITGPLLFVVVTGLLTQNLEYSPSVAIGTLVWMVYWWVTRPVNMTVTAFIPVLVNAFTAIVPMDSLISRFSSSSIILIFGSGILTSVMSATGLDRRISLKALSMIGPSMRTQMTVWFLASVILSSFMPNVAVCALNCPIAVAMLEAAGYKDMRKSKQGTFILLAIGWGAGIGGACSPLGGAMNITAISYLQEFSGQEYMYVDWVKMMLPYVLIVTTVLLLMLLKCVDQCEPLNGSREYFQKLLNELSPMSEDEKKSGILFLLAVTISFFRPLYASILPAAEPAYIFLFFGFLSFMITSIEKKPLIDWETVEKDSLWGMMILFGGGMALGNMIRYSGVIEIVIEYLNQLDINNVFLIILIFSIFAVILSELTNSTVSAAVLTPIILHVGVSLHMDIMGLWYALVLAFNAEFLLPISVRAIPVSYGLDCNVMLKKGISPLLVRLGIAVIYAIVVNCLFF